MATAIERTIAYLRDRRAFGVSILANQYVRFRLAELTAKVDLLRHYTYACAEAYQRGEDTTRFATIAKLEAGRLQLSWPTGASSSTARRATWRRRGCRCTFATGACCP